jgi:aspartate racemase
MSLVAKKDICKSLDYEKESCIYKRFEAQVEQTADAVAVVYEDKQLTYRELNARANKIAHYLQALGVKPDVLVGICMERSLEMVVGLLGILKAGGAYVPLDPTYPKERLSFMLTETQVPVLLTQKPLVEQLPQHESRVICLDTDWDAIAKESEENPVSEVTPQHLAYVMYTSGSTGKPKGVQINHANVWHYIQAISEVLQVNANDVYLHTASFSFSSSVRQLMVPLSQGATSIIATREQTKNPLSLFELIQKQGVTVSDTVPSVWRYGLQALENLNEVSRQTLLNSKLRLILLSGEITPCQLLKQLRNQLKSQPCFFNVYGQTETIGNCAYPVPDEFDREQGYVPVGYPYPHNQAYILDDNLQPVAVGEIGELHMAGACLARGYLNRPDLNAEKFISNPFVETQLNPSESTERLFKTGDVARYLPDGAIEILGRVDFQVKLRGMRVELGEIESMLEQHPTVKEAVVTAREDDSGDKRLVAYIVPKLASNEINQTVITKELRNFLKEKLADYMVPSAFVMLAALPLTPNGKVDRRALPAPDQVRQELEETFVAPQDELELKLTEIWEKVLGVQPIGVRDNFFELGGHSLLAVRLVTEVEKVFDKNLPLSSFVEAQTVEQLANLLRQQDESAPWRSLVMIQPGSTKPPLFCVHAVWGTVLFYQKLVRYLEPDQPFYALQAQGLDGKQVPCTSVKEMAAHYIKEIRTVQPEGPYFIGGYSFGGWVAFEIARQLHAQGQEIALLTLFDTSAPGYHKPTSSSDDGKPSTFLDLSLFHLRKLLRLNIQDQLAYLRQRLVWHLMAGKLSIFYRIYLRYLRRSPQDLRLLDVAGANNQAAKSYVPQVYPGRLTLFRATDKAAGFGNDLDMGWGELATGGVEIYDISGSHTEIMEEPQLGHVAEKLKLCLDKAQANEKELTA